jgi:hypothetical protein
MEGDPQHLTYLGASELFGEMGLELPHRGFPCRCDRFRSHLQAEVFESKASIQGPACQSDHAGWIPAAGMLVAHCQKVLACTTEAVLRGSARCSVASHRKPRISQPLRTQADESVTQPD